MLTQQVRVRDGSDANHSGLHIVPRACKDYDGTVPGCPALLLLDTPCCAQKHPFRKNYMCYLCPSTEYQGLLNVVLLLSHSRFPKGCSGRTCRVTGVQGYQWESVSAIGERNLRVIRQSHPHRSLKGAGRARSAPNRAIKDRYRHC